MLEYYRFKRVLDLFVSEQAAEAREELAALQRRYVSLCDENTTLKMQMQEYEDILYLARNLTFDGEFYWLETGAVRQGPFCPNCYDRDGLLMRLSGERHDRYCTSCRESYVSAGKIAAVSREPGRRTSAGGDLSPPAYRKAEKRAKVIPFVR
ncbi:MAG: hypothetical protein LBP61_09280 [Desulfovibrio sp.]|jgi:hypothetical protein|nr:hypothetical protein [Desulfovibrio sp.]